MHGASHWLCNYAINRQVPCCTTWSTVHCPLSRDFFQFSRPASRRDERTLTCRVSGEDSVDEEEEGGLAASWGAGLAV